MSLCRQIQEAVSVWCARRSSIAPSSCLHWGTRRPSRVSTVLAAYTSLIRQAIIEKLHPIIHFLVLRNKPSKCYDVAENCMHLFVKRLRFTFVWTSKTCLLDWIPAFTFQGDVSAEYKTNDKCRCAMCGLANFLQPRYLQLTLSRNAKFV